MNGAIAEPFASTSSTPKMTSVITIGASQYFLFSFMDGTSGFENCVEDEMTLLEPGKGYAIGAANSFKQGSRPSVKRFF